MGRLQMKTQSIAQYNLIENFVVDIRKTLVLFYKST